MIHFMHYMQILRLSDEIIKTYGRYPDGRDPDLQGARKIYKIAFGELVRQGMPYTREAGLLKIETDGEVYAIHEYNLAGLQEAPAREEKTYAVPVSAPLYTSYSPHYESDDESLDETRVMSFEEAMGQGKPDGATGQENVDEEYVQPAGDLLDGGDEGAGLHHEGKDQEEEDIPEEQEGEDGNIKQPVGEETPENAGSSPINSEKGRVVDWKPEGETYEEPVEEDSEESDEKPDDEEESDEEPDDEEPEDEKGESDGIIIPPEESVMDEPGNPETSGEQDMPETQNTGTPVPKDDKGGADTAAASSGLKDAEKGTLPPAALSSELQDALQKNDFTYSNGRIIIKTPNDAEEKAGVLSMPLSLDTNNPEFLLYCAVIGKEKKTFVVKGQGETIITIAGYKVAFSAWVDAEGDYKTSCRLDGDSAAIGASLSYRVRTAGRKGHIVLGDNEKTIRIHAMPTSFKDTEKGQPASVLYYVETADEESFGVSRPQTPIRFPYGDGYIRAGFIWKDGVLNGGIIEER